MNTWFSERDRYLLYLRIYFQIEMNSKLAYNLDFLSGALGASCNKELQILTKYHEDAHRYKSFDMDALHKHTLKWLDVVKNEGRYGNRFLWICYCV